MGLGPVLQDANIDIAAKNHSAYVATHLSGSDPHSEVVGKAGFTGVTVYDRLIHAGYPAYLSSEIIAFNTTFPIVKSDVVETLAATVYHRVPMMMQGFTHMGIAPGTDQSPTYINFGASKPQRNAGNYVGVYPVDGQTGTLLTHYMENPNPFHLEMPMTQENMCTKTSYPISLTSEASTTLSVTSFTVTEDGHSAPLAARLMTRNTSADHSLYLHANVAFIVGTAPFKKLTKYNVRFLGTITGKATATENGMAIDKSWSFTTGTDPRFCQF